MLWQEYIFNSNVSYSDVLLTIEKFSWDLKLICPDMVIAISQPLFKKFD